MQMNKITIFTDSCSSLTNDIIDKYNIKVIPICYTLDGVEHNPLENEMPIEDFYNMLEGDAVPKTACINPTTYIEHFEKELAKGNQVLHISMSSGLSGTYNNAVSARNELNEKYPNQIEIIDSLKGGMGMAFDIEKSAELSEKGLNVQQIKEEVDKNKQNIECLFTIGSIDYLKRSGRIKPTPALVAKVMKINPLIDADDNVGKLNIKALCIGRKKALQTMIDKVKTTINETIKKIYLCYTNNKQEAETMLDKLKNEIPSSDIILSPIDCSLGCHCGPRTLAIFFKRKASATIN